jgi:hypothetical protein
MSSNKTAVAIEARPTSNPLDVVPDQMPFDVPYGPPISLDRAGAVIHAAVADYINRALPDAELDAFVEALATRIAKFDKWAIAQTKRLVNTSLPPDVELGAGWDACIASLGRPAAQEGIKALMARGFEKPGDVENRLAYYLGQIAC